jgi:hypothetical protein
VRWCIDRQALSLSESVRLYRRCSHPRALSSCLHASQPYAFVCSASKHTLLLCEPVCTANRVSISAPNPTARQAVEPAGTDGSAAVCGPDPRGGHAQVSGFQGRLGKDPDSCYSFWIGATLKANRALRFPCRPRRIERGRRALRPAAPPRAPRQSEHFIPCHPSIRRRRLAHVVVGRWSMRTSWSTSTRAPRLAARARVLTAGSQSIRMLRHTPHPAKQPPHLSAKQSGAEHSLPGCRACHS